MMLQTVRTQDYFWALGVDQNAPAADIDRAYEALARSFHADRYRLAPRGRPQGGAGDLRQPGRGAPHAARSGAPQGVRREADARRPKTRRDDAAGGADRPRRGRATAPAQRPRPAAVERGGARALRGGPRAPRRRGGTTRPSRRCARRRAWSPTRPTSAPRSGGRCFGRPPRTRAPGGRRSPSCGARCSWTNATARPPSTWRRSTRRPGSRIWRCRSWNACWPSTPAATEVAEELHRLRTK